MYSCKQAVIDHVQAQSPVSVASIRRYCRIQASDYNVKTFLRALVELQHEGFMVRAEDAGVVYELADTWEQALAKDDSATPVQAFKLCKIVLSDGAWVKAEIPTDASQIDYVLHHFGMFSSIEEVAAFKVGDKVKETNYGHIGTIIAPGDDCDWLVEFEHGAVAQLQPNRLELVDDSVPCVPYAGVMSHTAISLCSAVYCRNIDIHDQYKFNQWDDEARYLAGVIISGLDSGIEG